MQPEYEGLDHTKRTRTPRKTQPKFLDLTETTANTSVSLEELLKPRYTSYTSAVFAYFGFYDEAEIARRRSLRLQGLDPEFEGLTWGQRYFFVVFRGRRRSRIQNYVLVIFKCFAEMFNSNMSRLYVKTFSNLRMQELDSGFEGLTWGQR